MYYSAPFKNGFFLLSNFLLRLSDDDQLLSKYTFIYFFFNSYFASIKEKEKRNHQSKNQHAALLDQMPSPFTELTPVHVVLLQTR